MTDSEHVQRFVVEVPVFGDPERTGDDLLLLALVSIRWLQGVARALHHGVKAGCRVAPAHGLYDSTEQFELELPPRWVTLDPKGDDQGHHGESHPSPLVDVEAFIRDEQRRQEDADRRIASGEVAGFTLDGREVPPKR